MYKIFLKVIGNEIDNEEGFVHTLEAILGLFAIIGVILFVTDGLPYSAQKVGEHSKIQLVDIGRDALDIVDLTSITDIFSNYSRAAGVYRQYTLIADKKIVNPNEKINFTVYYMDTNQTVNITLTLEQTVLGLKNAVNTTTINGSTLWSFPTVGEYNIRAYDGNPSSPTSWSNYVTIIVGYYYLDTDINGISDNSSKIVDGAVYDTSWSRVPNLTIQILDYKYNVVNNSAGSTDNLRIIQSFDSLVGWTSNGNISLNTTRTQGNYSLYLESNNNSINYIRKTDNFSLLRYDNLSFDVFSNTGGELINIELSKNNTSNKMIWTNIPVNNTGFNKINIQLKNPDYIIGNISVQDIDTINISVSGGNNNLFDNLTASAGSFSFIWPISGPGTTGTYYIQAIDSGGNISNRHRIIYSTINSGLGTIYSTDSIIYETDTTQIILIPNTKNDKFQNSNNFNINQLFYNNYDTKKIYISNPYDSGLKVNFTANTSGDYYIFYGNTGQGGVGDPAAAAKTNTILIKVLPFQSKCLFGKCKPKCSGLNMDDLNKYLRLFIPYNINYNVYLTNPDGTLCKECPNFKEIQNGYPTNDAVAVNKIFHITTINGEFLRELRLILWYK